MPIKFSPKYTLSPKIVGYLLRIEAAKEKVNHLPLTPTVLASLRETARLYTTHYSTMIEGNRLEPSQIASVLKHDEHFPGRERDENEVKGYYAALEQIEQWTGKNTSITEHVVKSIHALVMANGRTKAQPTPYREGQNVIRDSRTREIVYMPPEAKDVPTLMKNLIFWIANANDIPTPVLAAIAHYQYATIHPYYDGNGRTARLLTTLILHLGKYDLKGLYSLEEYYAKHLDAYYKAISIGPSHNYYLGRADADITTWIEYFIEGMAHSFENVLGRMQLEQHRPDYSECLRKLDPKQRKALELFQTFDAVTSHQIGELFGFKPRSSSQLCQNWVQNGFLVILNNSNKKRSYQLAPQYKKLL